MAPAGETVTLLKSAIVGLTTASIAVIAVTLAMLRVWMSEGSGTVFISISSWQILVTALLGFAAGFWFSRRRSRVRQA